MAKSDASVSAFSNSTLEAEENKVEDDVEKALSYTKLQARMKELMRKEKKLRRNKETDPLYWCVIAAEYSDCCGIVLKIISGDLANLFIPANLDETQDLDAIKRKYRVIKAYNLLFTLNDCFKRMYGKINEIYGQYSKSCYHSIYFAPSIQVFESKANLIKEYIDMLKQYVNTMFEMKHVDI